MTESVALRGYSDWPTLLVGPMVRKVTRTDAYVFIATRQPCRAQLLVARGVQYHDALADDPDPGVELWPIGEHLYVGLLHAELPEPGPDQLYSYDVQLWLDTSSAGAGSDAGPDAGSDAGSDVDTDADSDIDFDTDTDHVPGPMRLDDLGLLGTPGQAAHDRDPLQLHVPLGYAPGVLPSFVTPPADVTDLRLAHSSCRKPHGNPDDALEPDALPILDEIIARALRIPAQTSAPTAPHPTDTEADVFRPKEAADLDHPWFDARGNETTGAPSYPPHDLTDRPHQLILTGDQIYADDVAPALLDAIRHAADRLMGWEEYVPGIINGLNGFMLEPGWRTRYLALAGVKELPAPDASHDYPQSHLLCFGEWCAMYLMAWSPALWPRTADGTKVRLRGTSALLPVSVTIAALEHYLHVPTSRFVTTGPLAQLLDNALPIVKASQAFEKNRRETWEAYRDPAMQYGSTVPYVRRVLANTPTYMMFDDHEITDDWFVNRDVARRLLGLEPGAGDFWGHEVGPRILRNGLSAYAVFQHWGNVPEDFAGWETAPGGAGTSVGRQLLTLWAPEQPHQRPLLAGPDRSAIRAQREQFVAVNAAPDSGEQMPYWVDQDRLAGGVDTQTGPPPAPPDPIATSWLNEDDIVADGARLADDLLRISTYPTDSEGRFPGTGDPADRVGFGRFRWDYAIEFDSHRLIALDTRTWRRFPEALAPLPLVGSLTAVDHVAARDATAAILAGFASALTGTNDVGTALLGHVLADVAGLLAADLATATARLEDLADSLDGFLTFAATDPLAVGFLQGAIADLRAECGGTAPGAVRFVLDSDIGHWTRAAAILREVVDLFDLWESSASSGPVVTALTSLVHYLDSVVMGSSRAALEALRRSVNDVRDVMNSSPALFSGSPLERMNLLAAREIAVGQLTDRILLHQFNAASAAFFRDGTGYLAPELISAPALQWMVSDPVLHVGSGKETVILSPAPMFADDIVDYVQRVLLVKATKEGLAGAEEWDVEAWTSNPVGFDNFLVAAKALRRAVVLSGDVHYAYSTHNHVLLPVEGVDTVYVQLVASSAKNSDTKTKTIAIGGDLLFDGDGRFRLHQFNPVALARGWGHFQPPAGTPPSPGVGISTARRFAGWAGEYLAETLETLKQGYHLDDVQVMLEEFRQVRTVRQAIEWQVRWYYQPMYRAMVGGASEQGVTGLWNHVSTAPVNSFTGWMHESLWSSIENLKWWAEMFDDPVRAVFGHYLYSRDVLLQQIADLYKALWVDPAYGVTIEKTNLRDTRPDRLRHYGARNRFAYTKPYFMMYANEQEVQVVGSANIGLVRFTDAHGRRGVRHDLCFYPEPSHPGVVAPPPGPPYRPTPTPPDPGEVVGFPYPRTDWIATQHEARFLMGAP